MPARNRHLPRGLSWPLTASDVRAALGEPMADAVRLGFDHRPHGDGTLLHVEWIPQLPSNYGGGIHPTLWNSARVRVAPLPSSERAAARRALRLHALPELAAWIAAAHHAPEPWTLTRPTHSWRLPLPTQSDDQPPP